MERSAEISPCGRYRYLLRRVWDRDCTRALFVMLNPSTADAEIDDATIRSCIRLSRSWGHGGFEVINLFGWRATDPAELAATADPIGPGNAYAVETSISRCAVVIYAWGASRFVTRDSTEGLSSLVRFYHRTPFCLGTTKSGAPKHPLYIKSGTPLTVYRLSRPVLP